MLVGPGQRPRLPLIDASLTNSFVGAGAGKPSSSECALGDHVERAFHRSVVRLREHAVQAAELRARDVPVAIVGHQAAGVAVSQQGRQAIRNLLAPQIGEGDINWRASWFLLATVLGAAVCAVDMQKFRPIVVMVADDLEQGGRSTPGCFDI